MAATASFSGRLAAPAFVAPGGAGRQHQARRRDVCAARAIRGSLEEEFKKRTLGLSNGTSSSSSPAEQRLKDLSASASAPRVAGGDLAGSSSPPSSSGSASCAAAPNSSSSSPPSSSSSGPPASGINPGPSAAAPQQPAADNSEAFSAANLPPLGGEPYHPLEFYPTSQVDLNWGAGEAGSGEAPWRAAGEARSRCWVILFGVGRAETEGIYSLRAVAKDDGLPVDTIVAFENEDDALRYSTLLEATMDHEPTVWPIEWGELLEFCNSAGYRCRLEPSGSLLIPPDYNVGMTDWEKSLKLRKGEFSVLGAEPGAAPALPGGALADALPPGGLFVDGPMWGWDAIPPLIQDEEEVRAEQLSAVLDSQLSSPAALAAMKASLERLLPPPEGEGGDAPTEPSL